MDQTCEENYYCNTIFNTQLYDRNSCTTPFNKVVLSHLWGTANKQVQILSLTLVGDSYIPGRVKADFLNIHCHQVWVHNVNPICIHVTTIHLFWENNSSWNGQSVPGMNHTISFLNHTITGFDLFFNTYLV